MATKKSVKKSAPKSAPGSLVRHPNANGGALRHGSLPGNTPGTGRPPDAIRAAMRELGATKGLPFLSELLDGKIPMRLVGVCASCKAEGEMDKDWLSDVLENITASVDHRLKANEQALKYGLGTKEEVTIVSPDVQARLVRQVGVITAMLEPDVSSALLAVLDEVWA